MADTLFYVYFSAGQRPSEKGYMACHRQGRADLGGLRQAEHPLLQTVGGPETLGMEDGRGPAGDGLPMRKGCLSNPDPPDVPHTGGSLSGAGWALEGITAATRREPAIITDSVPAPAAKGKDKEAPQAVKGKSKEARRAVKGKGKEAPPALKGKEALQAVKGKESPPTAKVKDKEVPQAGKGKEQEGQEAWCRDRIMMVQPPEAAAEGLEPPPTTGIPDISTATSITVCSSASSRSPSGQLFETAGEGLEPPPTTASPATSITACSSASSSSPIGQPSEAAGDGQEPSPTTDIPDTSPATATIEQLSPPVASV
ncbi:hypothetical protein NDU88_004031 [Pleurodeles waltl]|uniref:Uncharacterized protein n=1 Tax=Pleurodeles waltl TaxID=8319 RepID=A0AAV7VJ18_PLEWA|nr:hypothetical protein NDU88_004031 [Pleurodeles waltl]